MNYIETLLHPAYITHVIQSTMKENPWMVGAFSVMGVGGAVTWLRNLPLQIWKAIIGRFIISITIDDSAKGDTDEVLSTYFEQNEKFNSRAKHLRIDFIITRNKKEHHVSYTPMNSTISWYKFRPILITRTKKAREASGEYIQDWSLKTLGLNNKFLKSFIVSLCDTYANRFTSTKTHVYALGDGNPPGWRYVKSVNKRSLETLFLPQTALGVIDDIKRFLDKKDWYNDLGIPHHRGYLLHGIPGAGKTSFIRAIAGVLNYNVFYLNLNDSNINDANIQGIFNAINPNSFVIIEDIDAIFSQKEDIEQPKIEKEEDGSKRVAKKSLSFSGFLNSLDGFMAKEGLIYFMTTNHKEKLDPALIRPGRVDYEVFFDYPEKDQISALFLKFFPNENNKAEIFATLVAPMKISMAKIQGHLLLYEGNPNKSISNIGSMNNGNSEEVQSIATHLEFLS